MEKQKEIGYYLHLFKSKKMVFYYSGSINFNYQLSSGISFAINL